MGAFFKDISENIGTLMMILVAGYIIYFNATHHTTHCSSRDEDGQCVPETYTVNYYNPSTGTRNSYDLDVLITDNEVDTIYFPNGGYIDESHIVSQENNDGIITVTTDEGTEYEVEVSPMSQEEIDGEWTPHPRG